MQNRKYDVVMRTPVGLRHGSMFLYTEDNRIYGKLDILGHTEPLEGSVDEEGNCKICGCIVTLRQTIPFSADGKISETGIDLHLNGKRKIFHLTGTIAEQS